MAAGDVEESMAITVKNATGVTETIKTDLDGGQHVTYHKTELVTSTTGGASVYRSIDLDESEEEVKGSAGQLYGYYFFNAAASVRYLKFYNATAASTTVGTTTPFLTMPLPAGAAGHISFPVPITFSTAICAAATTGLADNDTGAPSANDVVLNVFYK
jgi:hypothetical protein